MNIMLIEGSEPLISPDEKRLLENFCKLYNIELFFVTYLPEIITREWIAQRLVKVNNKPDDSQDVCILWLYPFGQWKIDLKDCPWDTIFIDNTVTNRKAYIDCGKHIRIYANMNELAERSDLLISFRELSQKAEIRKRQKLYSEAAYLFEQAAILQVNMGLYQQARDYYAYAAIMEECSEKWRHISHLWYSAYDLEHNLNYEDYNTVEHTYPAIDFEKWEGFSDDEKKGRALQYAAYSEENHGGPSDSYWLFEKAANEYLAAGCLSRAIECTVSATNRFAKQFHQIPGTIMDLWKKLLSEDAIKAYDQQLYISFEEIYRRIHHYDAENAVFFYIESKKIERRLNEANRDSIHLINLWVILTRNGTSIIPLTVFTFFLVVVVLPIVYMLLGQSDTMCQAILLSVDVFLSINNDISGEVMVHFFAIIETVYAYFFLVAVSTQVIGRALNNLK